MRERAILKPAGSGVAEMGWSVLRWERRDGTRAVYMHARMPPAPAREVPTRRDRSQGKHGACATPRTGAVAALMWWLVVCDTASLGVGYAHGGQAALQILVARICGCYASRERKLTARIDITGVLETAEWPRRAIDSSHRGGALRAFGVRACARNEQRPHQQARPQCADAG